MYRAPSAAVVVGTEWNSFSIASLYAVDVFRCAGRIPEGVKAGSDQYSNGLP